MAKAILAAVVTIVAGFFTMCLLPDPELGILVGVAVWVHLSSVLVKKRMLLIRRTNRKKNEDKKSAFFGEQIFVYVENVIIK